MRVFVVDDGGWSELTGGGSATARVAAVDLAQAGRAAARIRDVDSRTAVILDLTVAVADDFRSARSILEHAGADGTVRYAGTVDGLTGLVADIVTAGVADGVTLISVVPDQDARVLGRDVLDRLAVRAHAS